MSWRPHRASIAAISILGAFVFFAFAPSLAAAPIWDDEYLTTRNHNLESWQGVLRLVSTDIWSSSALEENSASAVNVSYRPLSSLSYALNRLVLGNSATAYHAGNIALHFVVTALLFVVIVRRKIATVPIALSVALLFATLPLVSEPVSWLAGRYDLLAAAFSLLALTANHTRRRRVWLTPLACAAAILSKEPYVIVAAFIVLDDVCVFRRSPAAEAPKYAAIALAVVSCFALRHFMHVAQPTRPFDHTGALDLARAYAFSWQTLAPLALHPTSLSLFHTYVPTPTATAIAVLGVLSIVVIGAVVWRRRATSSASRGAVLMGTLWCIGAMLACALAAPALQIIGDRYAYLPLIGAAIALSGLLMEVSRRARVLRFAPVALFALTALQCTRLESRLDELQTSQSMLLATLARDPENFTALSLWGDELARTKRYDEAEVTLEHARSVAPSTGTIDTGLSFVHLRQHRYAAAEADGRRAVAASPHNPRAWLNLASALVNQRKAPEASASATEALRLRPRYAEARFVRALASLQLGDVTSARADADAALAIDPNHAQARALLAHLEP